MLDRSALLAVVAALTLAAPLPAQHQRIPVVLSTDVGNEIDDQWAIVYLLCNPAFEVKGLCSAHGPTVRPPAGRTAYLLLRDIVQRRLALRVHPPLLEGASQPLTDVRTPRPSAAAKFLIAVSKDYSPQRRLNVLCIGAVTDLASAILQDPGIVDRIQVVDMGFRSWPDGADEFNIANDVHAMQVVLNANVPLVVGCGEVCKQGLAMPYEQARQMLAARGPIARWLWHDYQSWYYRFIKPLRKDDFSKPWIIWDNITLAYLLGMTKQETHPRPVLRDDLKFAHPATPRTITWITAVDTPRFWADFLQKLDAYEATHTLPPEDDESP